LKNAGLRKVFCFIHCPSELLCCIFTCRTQTVEAARAEAEKIRLLGGAEASAIEAVGKAEAERMRLKAAAYKQYGEAAMLSLVLESLPKVRIS
jgi:uncharacterized membrane protein YqiK